jgi:integrase
MDNVKKVIKENRPKIADSSLKTYTSIVSNLYKKVAKNDKLEGALDFFTKNVKEVMAFLKDVPPARRKTTLASLVVFTEKNEKAADQYRKQMLDDKGVYDDDQKDQKMSETQKENWVSQDELKKLYDQMDKENRPLLGRESLKEREFQQLQNFVILALYHLQPPRRLKDYTEMKLRAVDESKDNFIKKDKLVFNAYKTAKTHGREEVGLKPKLKFILGKWKNLNPHDYMLVSVSGKKLSSSQLQQRLNQILGKKASVNILRHSFLSEKYKDLPGVRELEERAADMGHTVEQALLYVKRDAPEKSPSPQAPPPKKKVVRRKKE